MRKTIIGIGCALALTVSLAACGSPSGNSGTATTTTTTAAVSSSVDSAAYASLQKVQNNLKNIKDAAFNLNMHLTLSGKSIGDIHTAMSGAGKRVVTANNHTDLMMDVNTTAVGKTVNEKVYVKDNMVYSNVAGKKIKVGSDSQSATPTTGQNLLEVSRDMLSGLSAAKSGQDTVYTFSVKPDKAFNYFKQNAGGSANQLLSSGTATFSKMDITAVAGPDDQVKSMTMNCAMSTKLNSTAVNIAFKLTTEFTSVNTGLTIQFPDFSQYKATSL